MKFEEENNRLNIEIRQLRKGLENAEQKLHGETLAVQKSESEVHILRFLFLNKYTMIPIS